MSFFSELKRRNVLRLAAGYVVVAWLIIQVASEVLPPFGVGDNVIRFIIVGLVVGLVPALVLAWVFEWTPQGVQVDDGLERDGSGVSAAAKRWDRIVMIVLAIAVTLFIVENILDDSGNSDASVAVMPFVNMSSDPDQESFSDGVAVETQRMLTQVAGLSVTSPASVFALKGQGLSVPQIAEKLNVSFVLEGSVRKSGSKIRITAQLSEAATDRQVWSETYDGTLEEIFAFEDDVAEQVVSQLRITLLGEMPRVTRVDPVAYSLYLQSITPFQLRRVEQFPKLVELLTEALEIEPEFVDAMVILAGVYHTQAWSIIEDSERNRARELNEESEALIARALEIDSDHAHALTFTAWFHILRDQLEQAAATLEEASRAHPNDAGILAMVGSLAEKLARTELAIRVHEHVARNNPLTIRSHINLADALKSGGRYKECLQQLEIASEINPDMPEIGRKIAECKLILGDATGALAAYEKHRGHPYEKTVVSHAGNGNGNARSRSQDRVRCGHTGASRICRRGVVAWAGGDFTPGAAIPMRLFDIWNSPLCGISVSSISPQSTHFSPVCMMIRAGYRFSRRSADRHGSCRRSNSIRNCLRP